MARNFPDRVKAQAFFDTQATYNGLKAEQRRLSLIRAGAALLFVADLVALGVDTFKFQPSNHLPEIAIGLLGIGLGVANGALKRRGRILSGEVTDAYEAAVNAHAVLVDSLPGSGFYH